MNKEQILLGGKTGWGAKVSHGDLHTLRSSQHTAGTELKKINKHAPNDKAQGTLQASPGFCWPTYPKGIMDGLPHRDRVQIFRTQMQGLTLTKELYYIFGVPEWGLVAEMGEFWNPDGSLHLHGYLVQATILSCLLCFDSILDGSPASTLALIALSQQPVCSCILNMVEGGLVLAKRKPVKGLI